MEKMNLISRGEGEVVRRECVCRKSVVIVVSGDGWSEWALLIDDQIAAESDAGYGGVDCALRDGLMFAACDMVLRDPEGDGKWQLSPWPEAITTYPEWSRPLFPQSKEVCHGSSIG